MSKKWKDVLSDSKTYGDDFVVTLGNGETMTLGDMRAYDREHEGELTSRLTAKEQELSTREKNVRDASVNLAGVIEKAAERAGMSVDDFLAGKAPTKRAVAAAADLDENDPLVGSLVKEIKGLRAEIASTKEEISNVKKSALGPMLNTYLEDYYETSWDQRVAPTLPKGSKVTRDEAVKYATENGLKDKKGRLDLAKAARDLTYDDRVRADAEARVSELMKQREDERVLAAAPRPSGTHINVKTDKSLLNDKGQTKNLDEVLNDAFHDVDLWKGVQGNA